MSLGAFVFVGCVIIAGVLAIAYNIGYRNGHDDAEAESCGCLDNRQDEDAV